MTTPAAGAQPTGSAGRLLQAGRERRGLELDALAQLLKVPVRKLQALEADRFEELPGAAFTRSLAQSYARQVGVDVQEVLALLPQAIVPPQRLEHVSRGLQTPYREGSGAHFGGGSGFDGFRPVHGIALALLALALLLWLMPPLSTLLPSLGLSSGSEPAAEVAAGSEAAASSTVVVETIHGTPGEQVVTPVQPAAPAASAALVAPVPVPAASAPPVAPAASAPVPAPATPAGTVVLKTRAASWIEVRDAGNAVLLSRTLQSGETVGLDGAMPMRVRVGVASALELSLRGEPVDLKPYTRGTSATVVLK
ncbi:hypothetical protein X805_20520 [Sphaerotilus natans subsp. natans DSM 6575]|uniref:Cytoskeleton protein RodZ-like C-terminal domain-containing protein n=1 Tax=Sphaerotilus natans subsp. natans DSM 6575 TaxID=1286631 RepID=A0A059KLT4_9BURK|nr:hypothetical protein X805_20520 [Sphaerotilus natans subsp. natans DSM 6575]